ncbi:MAG TPA: tRNA uridine-5-carboxymethylaminomethyl(34) synthesis GTPase MnmE [Myxococcota bacterium]|nr:tRNA uridine-5-carboxymethylaminomethyl(34) synthesis GTPase MnmE [Myxococcota bacterium]
MPSRNPSTDTIVAVGSPVGRGAVCVIRMSGRETVGILEKALLCRGRGPVATPRRFTHCWMIDSKGERIDEVLAVFFKGPVSYTGEDMGEVHAHGGEIVSSAVCERLIQLGARPAREGEFTRRAYENGKMDLSRAEAVMQVVDARTLGQLKGASRAISGEIGKAARKLGDEIMELLALVEATIDFPEESELGRLHSLDPLTAQLERLKGGLQRGGSSGAEVVFYGSPNVGKSSLVNALAGRKVSIVSNQAQTTRDAVTAEVTLHGVRVCLVDTAGLTDGDDLGPVEKEAAEMAREKIANAALPIRVTEVQKETPGDNQRPARGLWVINKIDLLHQENAEKVIRWQKETHGIPISVKTGQGIDVLEQVIGREIVKNIGPPDGVPANARQFCAIARIEKGIRRADEMISAERLELAAEDLKDALAGIDELTGDVIEADILDRIFANFCIGK